MKNRHVTWEDLNPEPYEDTIIPNFVWPRCPDCGVCVAVCECSLDYSPEEYLAECHCRSVTAPDPISALREYMATSRKDDR